MTKRSSRAWIASAFFCALAGLTTTRSITAPMTLRSTISQQNKADSCYLPAHRRITFHHQEDGAAEIAANRTRMHVFTRVSFFSHRQGLHAGTNVRLDERAPFVIGCGLRRTESTAYPPKNLCTLLDSSIPAPFATEILLIHQRVSRDLA